MSGFRLSDDQLVELFLTIVIAGFVALGIRGLMRPGWRIAGALALAVAALCAAALYFFATFQMRMF